MLDFQTFFGSIVSVSDLIASEGALKKAWIEGDESITSAFNYDELAQQVLDDQNVEVETHRFSKELDDAAALAVVRSFVAAFQDVDKAVRQNSRLQSPKELLQSEEWGVLRRAACSVIELPSAAAFRREFGHPLR
jgi:hypothetical protein